MDQAQLQQTFKTSLEKLSSGDTQASIEGFSEILRAGVTSSDTEYYLGRALFLNGETGKSVIHYLKAAELDRFNSDIRKELQLAQNTIEGGLGTPLQHPWEWSNGLSSYVRAEEFFFLSATFFAIFFVEKYLRTRFQKIRYAAIATALPLFFLGVFALFENRIATVKETTPLKEAPLESSIARRDLPTGARLQILRREALYSEVQRGSIRGWIKNEALQN